MGAYPTSPREDFLAWCMDHTEVFTVEAANIGLTAAEATAFVTMTTQANSSLTQHRNALQAAKLSTEECNDTFAALRHTAGNTVRAIKAFAEMQEKPMTVYQLAQIPAPQPPSPMPPPGQPTNLVVTLATSNGDLTLRWKCENPSGAAGTSYIIRRKLPTEPNFQFVGVSGKKEFVDQTLFAGPDFVQYTVQGQRSDSTGPLSEVFTVNFGRLPGGAMTANVTTGGSGINAADAALVDAIVNSKGNGSTNRAMARK